MRCLIKLLVISILFFSSNSFALEKSFFIEEAYNNCDATENPTGIRAESVDFIYDPIADTLSITAVFSDESGASIADTFAFGLNSEQALSFNHYKLPYFYVDGTELNSVAGPIIPKVRAYTFNRLNQYNPPPYDADISDCNSEYPSWNTGAVAANPTETILAPAIGDTNASWILNASASKENISGTNYRTYSILIDTAAIAEFAINNSVYQSVCNYALCTGSNIALQPSYNQWKTAFDFKTNITLDFTAFAGSTVGYTSNLISSHSYASCNLCRIESDTTNKAPECRGVTVTPQNIQLGESALIKFKFYDEDGANQDTFTISYTGEPSSNAAFSPADGATVSPTTQTFYTEITYTPDENDVESEFTITPKLVQEYGANKTEAEIFSHCIAHLAVSSPCNLISQESTWTSIKDNTDDIRDLLLNAQKQLNLLGKALGETQPKYKKEINQRYEDFTTTFNSIPSVFNACEIDSENTNFSCASATDYGAEYSNLSVDIRRFYCKKNSLVPSCVRDSVGSKLFKALKAAKAQYLESTGLSEEDALTEAKRYVNRKFKNKADDLTTESYSSVFDENGSLKLRRVNYSGCALNP